MSEKKKTDGLDRKLLQHVRRMLVKRCRKYNESPADYVKRCEFEGVFDANGNRSKAGMEFIRLSAQRWPDAWGKK